MNSVLQKNKGVGLLEVVVASAILSLVLFAFTSSLSLYSQASVDATSRTQALFLAEESVEVVRGLRDAGWTANIKDLAVDTPLGISFDVANPKWTIDEAPDVTGSFTRTLTFRDVYRDSADNIVDSTSETYDANSRLLDVEVSWTGLKGNQSVTLESVVANTFEN